MKEIRSLDELKGIFILNGYKIYDNKNGRSKEYNISKVNRFYDQMKINFNECATKIRIDIIANKGYVRDWCDGDIGEYLGRNRNIWGFYYGGFYKFIEDCPKIFNVENVKSDTKYNNNYIFTYQVYNFEGLKVTDNNMFAVDEANCTIIPLTVEAFCTLAILRMFGVNLNKKTIKNNTFEIEDWNLIHSNYHSYPITKIKLTDNNFIIYFKDVAECYTMIKYKYFGRLRLYDINRKQFSKNILFN